MPVKGDWGTTICEDIEELNIKTSFMEIKSMTKNQFKKIVNKKICDNALIYLLGKQKKKGSNIKYKTLETADYLLSNKLSFRDQIDMFSVRNDMFRIPNNFTHEKSHCITNCGEIESMEHIYMSKSI